MNKVLPDQPPPYNQIDSSSVPQYQGAPPAQHTQPAITLQPLGQQQQVVNTIQIVHTGNPLACRHNFRTEFTCCGIFCAIFLFPIGLICCFCMRKQRCKNCNLYA